VTNRTARLYRLARAIPLMPVNLRDRAPRREPPAGRTRPRSHPGDPDKDAGHRTRTGRLAAARRSSLM